MRIVNGSNEKSICYKVEFEFLFFNCNLDLNLKKKTDFATYDLFPPKAKFSKNRYSANCYDIKQ